MPPCWLPVRRPSLQRYPSSSEVALLNLLHRGAAPADDHPNPEGEWRAIQALVGKGAPVNAPLDDYPLLFDASVWAVGDSQVRRSAAGLIGPRRSVVNGPTRAKPLVGTLIGLALAIGLAIFWSVALEAAESPETVLIRQVLNAENFAQRRGDVEGALSFYAVRAVVYEGGGRLDPRHWSIRYEQVPSLARSLAASGARYQWERSVVLVHVLDARALAITVDSQPGAVEAPGTRALWLLAKEAAAWKITEVVHGVGGFAGPAVAVPRRPADQIGAVLWAEAEAWNAQQPAAIAAFYAGDFTAIDGYGTVDPATWKIVFAQRDSWVEWVRQRLQRTTYQVQRQLVYAQVGPNGREALAVSRDALETRYERGSTRHQLDRYVLWMLHERDGEWRIRRVFYHLGIKPEKAL